MYSTTESVLLGNVGEEYTEWMVWLFCSIVFLEDKKLKYCLLAGLYMRFVL